MKARALLADDEALLNQALARDLRQLWPELEIVAMARNGREALEGLYQAQPDVAWLDIRMPGLSGLEVAEALVEDWDSPRPPPLLVFVTAFDEFAVQAFDRAAIDYLLKPVTPERLAANLQRVQARVAERRAAARPPEGEVKADAGHPEHPLLTSLITRLQPLFEAAPPAAATRLQVIRASIGDTVHFVPVDQVLYLQATDKYVNVVTAGLEYLIREPLRELIPRLDPQDFVQIHRGTVVRLLEIARAGRDERGRLVVHLRSRPESLVVSRLHAHAFRPM